MISDGTKKITVRSLGGDTYIDELPLNWHDFRINGAQRRFTKKSFRIMKREYSINSYPEE